MALLPGPLLMALLALGWGTRVEGSEGTVPLQTLHCYNDYTSRIVCSWADTEAAGQLINVTLHRRLKGRCVIPYQGFVLADNDYYSFQPDRLLHIQRTVTLAQHDSGHQGQPGESRKEVALPLRCEGCGGAQAGGTFLKEELDGLYTRQSCQIRVSSLRPHGQYTVAVRPRNEETFIKSSEHIQMEAPTLNVTKAGGSYSLRWEAKRMYYSHIENIFQVQYRKDKEEWEDSKTETLKNAHSMPLPPLQPATTYWARNGSAGLWLPDSMVAFVGRSAPHQGPGAGLFPELEGLCAVDHRDSEVSPLTTEDPKVVCDPPSGSRSTLAASDLTPEQVPSPQPGPPATQGRPEDQLATFDFNGPYLGSPHSCSLPDLAGQRAPPQGPKPALPGSLEYLCLPPGGQVQLVPLTQVTGQGQAAHEEVGGGPAPPASEPRGQAQDPEDSPAILPTSSEGPEHLVLASGYVTTADLALTLSTGASSVSLAPALGLQDPCLCPGLPPAGPPITPLPEKPGFEGYVELPPTMGAPPMSLLGSPASSNPVLSPGEPRADVPLPSPTPEGLLVLQQVGDYSFFPGLGPGPFSPRSKPSSPGPCPERADIERGSTVQKPPDQPVPQVPAIQFF
ncbi:Cytokine receptor common subunit beta [Heterocephalus glaber]|uniref:Cytokine receptor common subunit beta n=1 Tax=Heterocephalus glaber TaxID=10181 RepID=G5BAV9_HETGA|nr:Cytokine receptor common subunit beta [Heterocephalus glaber]